VLRGFLEDVDVKDELAELPFELLDVLVLQGLSSLGRARRPFFAPSRKRCIGSHLSEALLESEGLPVSMVGKQCLQGSRRWVPM
jgi:hypothetical protein